MRIHPCITILTLNVVLYLKYFLHNAMLTRYFFHSCVQNIFPYSSEIFKVTPEVIYI